jgi:hypothetical protein
MPGLRRMVEVIDRRDNAARRRADTLTGTRFPPTTVRADDGVLTRNRARWDPDPTGPGIGGNPDPTDPGCFRLGPTPTLRRRGPSDEHGSPHPAADTAIGITSTSPRTHSACRADWSPTARRC